MYCLFGTRVHLVGLVLTAFFAGQGLAAGPAASQDTGLIPVGLRCEYLVDPFGIGEKEPAPQLAGRIIGARPGADGVSRSCRWQRK